METMPAIAIILPPRTRLHELKQSAHFPFDEVQHSIKTWINMASLLVKQGLMAESQRDDENAYISFIRACMIITKIIPHQACYASMMNDIACIDLRQKILSIVTRLGHLERRLLDKFEKDNQFQKQQQQQQQQMLQPAAPTEQFLRVASPEPPAIEARTSSLGAATTSRPSSTEPHLSPSMNSERIMSSSRQHPPSPPSSDSDFASKGEGDDDDDEDDDDVDNDDEVEEALESCYTTSAFAYTKSDSLQTRGEKNKKERKEKRSDGTRQAVPGDGTTEEAEEEAEEQDTNMLKVDVEQNSMPRRREHPEILLLDEDDPILEYGAKDQICQARVQVDVIEDGEIVISERSSNSTTNEGAFHSSSHHHNLFGEDEDQVPHQQEDEDEDADIAEEETELTFDLTTGVREGITHRDHKETNQKDKEDDNDYPQTRARAPSHEEAFELNLDPASYAVRRRQAIQQQRQQQQQQQQLEANIHTVTKTTITATTPAQRPRFVTAPLPFPAGNLLDEKERAAATTVQPRPRQSLTIYRTPLNERDDRSAFHQSVPGLEDNVKRTNHHHHQYLQQQLQQQQQLQPYPHVRRCSSSDALSRSATVSSHFPGKHLPEPFSSQQYQQQQQQQQQQQANTRSKRISPPPRSPHRISVQILSSFPVSAPLPTPPPTHSPTFSQMLKQQQEQQQQQNKMMRTESIASTVHDLDPSQQQHHHYHHHHHLSTPPLGRPSLSPSSPRQSMDQMSVQGSSHDGLLSSPPPPMQYPSNKASSGSLPLNLHHLHRRVPTTTKTTSPSAHLGHVHAGSMSSNHSGSASPASAYSSPVSSPMVVQSRQMSGGSGGGASHLGFSTTTTTIPSSLPSPKLSNVAKMAAMAGTTSTMTTVSSCSEGSTVSNHMAMSSISSSTTVVTALSTVTLVSSQPTTPVFPPSSSSSSPSFNKLASIPCSPALSPVPGVSAGAGTGGTTTTPSTGNNTIISSTITTPTLHSFRKPGLLRKIRSRPKMGDSNSSNNPIFEMVDTATSAAANAPPPMALLMHVNPNASLRG
ncbi:hypothetical protein DFQ27_004318 [Actinomortierella ambigua]|uniref:USP8 dimerisation domain-containing protein n=1 Tax=Actinomortierella ambigua TaxID=1343610 RepID=A0A9P6UCC5_9FUNG|nr:hypothetical protein DFQ27_004318 [Actinomortierella ambigua]